MNLKRPLMPGFLKKGEQKLLLNKPGIWSTRVHLVLYYGVLFILFLAALCFLEPKDVRAYSTTKHWIGFVSIISVIGLTVWLIYLLRFNVFKKYGNIQPLHGLIAFLLYFIAAGVIVLFPYVHPVVESLRANYAYDDDEIVRDVNNMNLKIGRLEYHLFKTTWDYDTIALVKDKSEEVEYPDEYERARYYRLDSTAFFNRMDGADSLVKVNDTTCLVYDTPSFDFVSGYGADDYTKEKVLTAFELFHKIYNHPPAAAEREKISKELNALLKKYRYPESNWYEEAVIEHVGPFEKIDYKYGLPFVNSSIRNIIEKKHRWEGGRLTEAFRILFYVTLGITLLIFIFRHATVRTFFLSLLTGVLLVIFTALLFSFSNFEETSIYACLVIYTFLFLSISLAAWSNRKRYALTGIGINLFVFIISFFPLFIVGWCYAIAKDRHYKKNDHTPFDPAGIWDQYFLLAEIGGMLLLLILLATYISKVYRRWYSLPEN
jgi:hypothetical protein